MNTRNSSEIFFIEYAFYSHMLIVASNATQMSRQILRMLPRLNVNSLVHRRYFKRILYPMACYVAAAAGKNITNHERHKH